MVAYRIADGRHPIFSSMGAVLYGGRWNSAGLAAIYAAETYAAAMLEVLVHVNSPRPPRTHQFVRIEIPERVSVETADTGAIEGWADVDPVFARGFGDRWFKEKRSAVLRVPSVVTQGPEMNLVINTEHADFRWIKADAPRPVLWDARLFPGGVKFGAKGKRQ
jgi:RES domain-containing protein